MRCYFIYDNHVDGVEFLRPGDDEDLIKQGWAIFNAHPKRARLDGFEVWDRARFIYRFPAGDQVSLAGAGERQTETRGR
jgi:hypothetical protein